MLSLSKARAWDDTYAGQTAAPREETHETIRRGKPVAPDDATAISAGAQTASCDLR